LSVESVGVGDDFVFSIFCVGCGGEVGFEFHWIGNVAAVRYGFEGFDGGFDC